MAAVGAVTLWRGRDDERLAYVGLLGAWAVSMMVFRRDSEQTQTEILFVDLTLFAIYVWIALRSHGFWPLFVAAFQLLAFVTHIARVLDPSITGWAYLTAERVWSYLVLLTIGYASWTAPYRHSEI
ncbi:hypothetical protein [Phenylobacterium sp.]|uniref:hypothetical protein n=1 Tax=Phenylobacterium sp. TaxID=1871053 RepID=UPI0025E937CA|nr:hypothetical protein [Phenylobacterium sp.]MBX3483590.1 hypothetical protein [Phenylobacterium sp.]MCW5760321.1 hypothetical protein [Phenylobacterium sp.]